MDKAYRGQLLADKEEVELEITRLRATLAKSGDTYSRLGDMLKRLPESLGFTKQGHSVRSMSTASNFTLGQSFDVRNDLDIEKAVAGVVALQDALDKLGKIQRELDANRLA